VSEPQAEQTYGETGAVAEPTVPPSSDTPADLPAAAAVAMSVLEAPAIAPDHEAPKADEPKAEMPKAEGYKFEAPKFEAQRMEASRVEVAKTNAQRPGAKVLIMAPSDRGWHDHSAEVKVETEARPTVEAVAATPKRRFGMVAMLALATVAGAIGGALATTGLSHIADAAATTAGNGGDSAVEASIARIDSDILALKAGLEHTSKMGVSQFNKTNDRLDKIEKAQAEPAAKLAKLTEAVDKLRAAPPAPAAAPAAAAATPRETREITGSVTPAPAAAAPVVASATPAPATPAKPDVGRLPTVDGWALTDVGYGGALIESRRGTYEVYAGDVVPGLGRIDAIRKQDGRWVVVTSKGLIIPR
jgi:hypothetical protein